MSKAQTHDKFSERLVEALIKAGYTRQSHDWYRGKNKAEVVSQLEQADLARELGCSRSTINRWLSGEKEPSLYYLSLLVRKLGVSAEYLLGISETDASSLWSIKSRNGVAWIEYLPSYLRDPQRKEIEKGLRVFESAINQVDIEDITAREHPDSWTHLSLALKSALEGGFVRIVDVDRNYTQEKKLKEKYGLKDAIVAAVESTIKVVRANFIAFLAARDAFGRLENATRVGIGSGYTILRMVELSTPSPSQFNGVNWLPLVTYRALDTTHSANSIVHFLKYKFPGSKALHFPYTDKASPPEDLKTRKELLSEASSMSSVFLSVIGPGRKTFPSTGKPDPDSDFWTTDFARQSHTLHEVYYSHFAPLGIQQEFGGSVLEMMLDKKGNEMGNETVKEKLEGFASQIPLRYLNTTNGLGSVWVIATCDYKAEAVRMMITSGLANAIVIDTEIASILLK